MLAPHPNRDLAISPTPPIPAIMGATRGQDPHNCPTVAASGALPPPNCWAVVRILVRSHQARRRRSGGPRRRTGRGCRPRPRRPGPAAPRRGRPTPIRARSDASAIASISAPARRSAAGLQPVVRRQVGAVLGDRGHDVVDALRPGGDRPDDLRGATRPARASPSAIMPWMSRYGGVGAVPVGLVDHEDVGDLEDAGLHRLDRVAHARGEQHQRGVGQARRPRPRPGPTPTVSTRTTSQPAPSSTRTACGVAADSPPRWPRLDIDRM